MPDRPIDPDPTAANMRRGCLFVGLATLLVLLAGYGLLSLALTIAGMCGWGGGR